jgi:hypothetical protein
VNVSATSSALPTVDQAREPSWVRNGSATTKQDYQNALAFEQTLVEELSQSLTASSSFSGGEEEGGEGGSEAAGGALSSELPQALASGVLGGGGLGLASELTRGMMTAAGEKPAAASATAPAAAATTGVTGAVGAPTETAASGGTAA